VAENSPTVQFLSIDGEFAPSEAAEEYLPYLADLNDDDHRQFYRDMAISRRFDEECTNLQRQGQMGLWPPSHGQEAAQVGSARASRPQDVLFPTYREHAVGLVRGIDILDIVKVMRGTSLGGWDANDPKNGNFRNYTLVIGSQTLHATGYAMGVAFDGLVGTGDQDVDTAVMVYFGDGSTSQGDVSESFVFAASNQTPQVFFLQNNQWAISVPVSTQSRIPLYLRARGFGIPSVQIDGNDVLASFAATRKYLDEARAGAGPAMIEALTYRIGAHTTSDDPSRYQTPEQLAYWVARDPIKRFEAYLRAQGADEAFFTETAAEANDFAADLRHRTLTLEAPPLSSMFEHVYSEPHPVVAEQHAWLNAYESSLREGL
jgi:2-oxoisovalerate dehydrogenase E1 component alpha subunit